MNEVELKRRTKEFALRAVRLVDALPQCVSADVLGKQLIRSATSVGANYRSACRGRSTAEFIAKLGIVAEEADESEFWLELISDANLLRPERVESLRQEAGEIVAIVTASIRTTKANSNVKRNVKTVTRPQASQRSAFA